MTPSIAPVANLAPPPNAPANDATNASSNDPNNTFSKPLQQAHQQLAQQTEPSRPTHGRHAASKSAPSGQPAAKDAKDQKDDDKSASATPDATAAMLALLGQSVPASAAASAVPAAADGDDAADAVTAASTAGVTSANFALLGAAQAAGQAKPDGAGDFSKAMDGVKDKSLSMLGMGSDDGDDAVDTSPDDTAQAVKGDAFASALQALTTPPNQGDHSDSLEALKNLTAQAMSPQPQQSSTVAATPAPHALTMQSSVGSPSFGQELSQQVTWLGGQDVKEARIRLHPEDLGELDVKVSVKQDHVDVAFIAQHPQAVHAVQQTLSQLDSMLAHHGLSLGQAHVGQGNTGQGSGQSASSGGSSAGGLAEGVGELVSIAAPVVKAVGLVDMFA
ncbi:flagellar hook-length control protein FliK [Dyella kyungheensis]|uniref:flagellar hook-length control protein FliK n=1 Tax=Dyella kyungheensis TaxID=1242174 RepID=UPI003CF901C5